MKRKFMTLFACATLVLIACVAVKTQMHRKDIISQKLEEINVYLTQKYNEEIHIYDYGTSDGFRALAHPTNNQKLNFSVLYINSAEIYDDYLECCLSNELETLTSDILFDLGYENFSVMAFKNQTIQNDVLYEYYKKLIRPVMLNELNNGEHFEKLNIRFNADYISSEEIKNIKKHLQVLNLPINEICILNKDLNVLSRIH